MGTSARVTTSTGMVIGPPPGGPGFSAASPRVQPVAHASKASDATTASAVPARWSRRGGSRWFTTVRTDARGGANVAHSLAIVEPGSDARLHVLARPLGEAGEDAGNEGIR